METAMGTTSTDARIDTGRLAREHGDRLKRFIARRVGVAADVEDIAQMTLLEAHLCAHRFKGDSKPETWLFGIAANLIRGHYRRASRMERPLISTTPPDEADGDAWAAIVAGEVDPQMLYEARDALRRVESRMELLSESSLQTLTLFVEEGLSYREIGDRLHIPVGTVRSRINRARALLATQAQSDTGKQAALLISA
jgi:RNA polymerase sigma-70 factor (ECF subfamily)